MRIALGDRLVALGLHPRRADPTGISALARRLRDPRRYERQIDRLHQRHMGDGGLWTITESGVGLGSVVVHRGKVARMLARSVSNGEYQLRPALRRTVRTEGKDRVVYRYSLFDLIVHGVVAEVLSEAVLPTLSHRLYSYQKGVSWLDGPSDFAAYTRAHHRRHADPRQRGLYVLRRDIASYTDSIPVDAGSAIWSQILDALELDRSVLETEPGPWPLVRDVVRTRVRDSDGDERALDVGVATGQPVASLAFNLYLRDMDHELAAIPGGFYARYSDDLLFAHPDPTTVRGTAARIEQIVASLRLRLKASKSDDIYLTGAGRPSSAWPEARGARSVTFLGLNVALDGTVSLGGRKLKRLLREARRRTANSARATRRLDQDVRGRRIVASLNRLLDAHDAALQGAPAPLLAAAVTDRGQLEWLDHELARMVATAVSGNPRASAFRSVPYRTIRSRWGLRSTRRARDRAVAQADASGAAGR